jgi:iron complex transport system substrate-binding protein
MSRARAMSVLAALVLGAALAAGGPGPSATPVAAAAPAAERAPVMPTRVRGVDGRTIVIRSAARIVSLNGDLTETIYALGLGGNLVGVDTSATFPAAAARVTSIGYQRQLSAEGILALRPTVVIGSTLAGPAPVIAQLKAAGVPTVIIPEDDRLTAPMSKIRSVARILGVPQRGRALADRTQRQIRAQSLTAARAARGVARPRVAFLYLRGSRVQMIGGTGTRSNIIIRLARGIDAGAETGVSGYRQLTPESLIASRPEVLVVPAAGLESVGGIDGLLRIPGVAQTPAGRDRRVVAFDDQLLLGLGPRTGSAIRKLAAGLYPGRL